MRYSNVNFPSGSVDYRKYEEYILANARKIDKLQEKKDGERFGRSNRRDEIHFLKGIST